MERVARTFKTKWFAKEARKELLRDAELCLAINQVRDGQAENLGGGVYKKRLGKNKTRSIILAEGGKYWIFVYLFAKSDRENIREDELSSFKKLAKYYANKNDQDILKELEIKELLEICI